MLIAFWNEVEVLHRQSIATIDHWDLELGEWRYLSEDEVNKLTQSL